MQLGQYRHPPAHVITHEEPTLSTASKNPMVFLQAASSYTSTPEIACMRPTSYLP